MIVISQVLVQASRDHQNYVKYVQTVIWLCMYDLKQINFTYKIRDKIKNIFSPQFDFSCMTEFLPTQLADD